MVILHCYVSSPEGMVFEVEPNVEPMTKPFPQAPAPEAIPKTFHKWGYPKSWIVFLVENPNIKWMI